MMHCSLLKILAIVMIWIFYLEGKLFFWYMISARKISHSCMVYGISFHFILCEGIDINITYKSILLKCINYTHVSMSSIFEMSISALHLNSPYKAIMTDNNYNILLFADVKILAGQQDMIVVARNNYAQ